MPPGDSEEESARLAPWIAYATAKAVLGGDDHDPESVRPLLQLAPGAPLPSMKTPLEIERLALKVAMQSAEELKNEDPIWPLLRRAEASGHLDDVIFLNLMDDDLVDAYRSYRNEHRESLMACLMTVLAPTSSPKPAATEPAGAGAAEKN